MLSQLIQILEQNQGDLDLNLVSQQIGTQPSVVAGMLQLLVQKGRIDQLGANCGPCEGCKLMNGCPGVVSGVKRYRLVE